MLYNGTKFNVDAVIKRPEEKWIEWASKKYKQFNQPQLKEIHQLATKQSGLQASAVKSEIPVTPDSTPAGDIPPGTTDKGKASASKK